MGEQAWWVREPSPALRPHATAYIGYRIAQQHQGVHRGLPSGAMTFIVSLADDIRVLRHIDPGQHPSAHGCVLAGLHTRPALIAREPLEEGVAIELTPLGSRALLGRPAADLAGVTVEGSDVLGAVAVELRERLAEAVSWSARFAVLDEILARRLSRQRGGAPPAVTAAWGLLARSGGRMPITAVADRVGCSRRHLSSQFSNEFGVSPKAAARALRFGQAVSLLRAEPRRDLATVAYGCGYSDQSHLAREFRALAGCAPTAWLREEFPSVQDSGEPAAAGST